MGVQEPPVAVPQFRLRPGAHAKRELRRWIEEGLLPAGDRLPPELQLAEQLGVARGTLRTAFRELEAEGLLSHVPGKGRVVSQAGKPESNLLAQTVVHLTWMPEETLLSHRGSMDAVDMGIAAALKDAGLHVLALHPGNTTEEQLRELIAGHPRGVILSHMAANQEAAGLVRTFAHTDLPIVAYGDERCNRGFARVVSDHRQGAKELTQWLIAQGRRRILRVWHEHLHWEWLAERNAGVEEAARRARLKLPEPRWVRVLPRGNAQGTREQLEARAREFARVIEPCLSGSQPVDAIELITDADVYPVAVALRLLGKVPNRDVLIAGYDNYWPSCWEREFEPTVPVATVDKFNRASGARMVQMLLEMPRRRKRREAERVRIKPRLMVTGEADFGSDLT